MKYQYSSAAVLTTGIAALLATPLLFVIYSALTTDGALWIRLWQTRLPFLFSNTLSLLLAVGLISLVLGVSLAWIMARYEFTGKRIWKWLVLLPFAMPGYVLAYAYATIMAPGGIFHNFWVLIGGDLASMPSLYSFWGVALILSLVNYPYVYLLTYMSLLKTNAHYEESALLAGASKTRVAWSITLPMARPAIIAGLALALMEVLADYGTVALLRYPTFTEAIVRQMQARFDPYGAAAIGAVVLILTISLMLIERYFRGRKSYTQVVGGARAYQPQKLRGKSLVLVSGFFLLVAVFAFFAPVAMLIRLSLMGSVIPDLLSSLLSSLIVAFIGATVAVVVVLPIAYLNVRNKTFLSKISSYAVAMGYSLPGPVIAVGLTLLVTTFVPALFGGFVVLIFAYLVRFSPIALQSQEAAIQQVSTNLEDAARILGKSPIQTVREITLSLIKPAVFTAWILVFVDIIKELPATMMLRPLAFDTLAIQVWMMASEELWELAAAPALLIVIVGLFPIIYFVGKMEQGGGGRDGKGI